MNSRCEEDGCTGEAVVGLQGVALCLDHYGPHLEAMKKTLEGLAKLRVREAVR